MSDESFFSRIINYIWFDITHLDWEIFLIYLGFLRNKLNFLLTSKPDLSSEILHWKRFYHQLAIENPDKVIFERGKTTKKSIVDSIELLKKKQFGSKLLCLDVGCGPTSQFYTVDFINRTDVEIINIDPLAEIYKQLHKKYSSNYDINYITGYGEELSQIFPRDYFHLIYTQNSLDHSQHPKDFINSMYQCLKPDGIMILHGFIKEGSAAHWLGLHQWDIEVEDNDLLLSNHKKTIYHMNLTSDLNLTLINKDIDGKAIGDKYTLIFKKN